MLGSAKAETQLTIIEVTEHDLFLSPGVIPSQYIYRGLIPQIVGYPPEQRFGLEFLQVYVSQFVCAFEILKVNLELDHYSDTQLVEVA